MISVRIRGIDTTIRKLVNTHDGIYDNTRDAINTAAAMLLERIKAKFGVYQSTGGDPGGYGSWQKLKYNTIKMKLQHGYPNKPLIMTGNTMNSFSIKEGGEGRLSASVSSSSKVLIHHIYGAPKAHVPMRDPARITAMECKQECHDMIEKAILDAIRRSDNG